MWRVGIARTAAAAAAAGLALCAPAAAWAQDGATPSAQASQPASLPDDGQRSVTNDIRLDLGEKGVLHAEESIAFGEDPPEEFVRTLPVREPYDAERSRIYEVDGISAVDGGGRRIPVSTHEDDGTLDVRMETAGHSAAVLSYTVRGAVDPVGGGTELEWTAVAGYGRTVAETTVVVDAAAPPRALSCTAGRARSSIYCTSSDMGGHEAARARFLQTDMQPEESLHIVVSYPADAIGGEAIIERDWSLTSAFAITPATATVFGLLLLVPVGILLALIRIRGRDERAIRTEASAGDSAPVDASGAGGEDGSVRFRPPDDVHPGQIGTLIDEQADVVDITATVVDLAVRGHMTIRELPHAQYSATDWRLDRAAGPLDDALLGYERLLLDALFQDADQVKLSELGHSGFPDRLVDVREELYRDMVRLKWFANKPNLERNRWTTAGIGITVLGAVLTVVLAVATQWAFPALAVAIAGSAVTVGAQYMPAKTRQGSVVFAHTLGFRCYLLDAGAEDVPREDRVAVFSRYLPYAVIFDNVDRWAAILASASGECAADLPWYSGPDDWRMEDFADSIRSFTLTLTGVISNTRQFRTLR
ncbi:DUF2207 domain-containing protein [Streptomonospora salina]|uniref:Predicted membrane protein YciQ-like C-terminal domain-containing protein n=1 Tax=Streptomonospora salina TaxID=104205 RepID=A0A841E7L3_9ACTN|nr:DUF2207 domain-containing protein [Streptomonospora salina]MBB5999135.1 hypothetical protein [Streptomonospora salina]